MGHNFKHYFLRIEDYVHFYDLGIEQSLKQTGAVIPLLYHKSIDSRFVGIYQYQPNLGTLYNMVTKNSLSVYEKYSYMISLTRLIITILTNRKPDNEALFLDIRPENLLILRKKPFTLSFLKLFHRTFGMNDQQIYDRVHENTGEHDSRPHNVFSLGLVFFFICFEIPLDNFAIDDMIFFVESFEKNLVDYEIDPVVFKMIRIMLNESPVDRPTLPNILSILKEAVKKNEFLLDKTKFKFNSTYWMMNYEVEIEKFQNQRNQGDLLNREKKNLLKDLLKKINKTYSLKKQKKLEKFISKMEVNGVKKMITEIRDLQMVNVINPNDKFGMINDAEWFDFHESVNYEFNLSKFNRIKYSTFYKNDLLDLKYTAYELINFNQFTKNQKKHKVLFQKDRLVFLDPFDIDIYSEETFDLIDLFLVFIKTEILSLADIHPEILDFSEKSINSKEKKEKKESNNI